jgi:hypothetical protein
VIHVIACICANCVYQDPETKQCNKVKKLFYQKTADEETCVGFKCRAPWVSSQDRRALIYAEIETAEPTTLDKLDYAYGALDVLMTHPDTRDMFPQTIGWMREEIRYRAHEERERLDRPEKEAEP